MTKFSVLLPVYAGDTAAALTQSWRSITTEQTLFPDDIVVVIDGPIGDELETVVATMEPAQIVRLETNQGLAEALNIGLRHCRHDIVARQDADDISLPHRFATQIPVVAAGYDLVGADIEEFGDGKIGPRRQLPVTQAEIKAALSLRDPFAHPAVVYRRSKVMAVGGYEQLANMEDYWLFARMVAANMRCCNIAQVLVRYRVDAGAYRRRGGIGLFRSEVAMQRRLYALGVTSSAQLIRNLVIRGGYRFIPASVRRVIYRNLGLKALFNREND